MHHIVNLHENIISYNHTQTLFSEIRINTCRIHPTPKPQMIRPMNKVGRFFIVKRMDPSNASPKPTQTTTLLPNNFEHTNEGSIDTVVAK